MAIPPTQPAPQPPPSVPVPTLDELKTRRFPPFPSPPPGVTITPFTSFKPIGLRVPINEDDLPELDEDEDEPIEVDGLGIPTVALKVKHTLDATEKVKRRKKKGGAKGAGAGAGAPKKPRTWWEEWDELEFSRTGSYDRNTSAMDRFASAAVDFKQGRPWPSASTGLHNLWDQFRLYTGLLSQPNPNAGSKKHAAVSDDEDDLDDEHEPMHVDPPRKETTTDITVEIGRRPSPAKPAAQSEEKYQWEEDIRMDKFLNDPERSVKIFFSSYFRDRGLIWAPARCQAFPTLISFFLRFLLRSKTFWEPHIDKPLRRALDVVELARKELPATARIGAALPDTFSDGLRELWGSKRPGWNEPITISPNAGTDEKKERGGEKDEEGPATKRLKRDDKPEPEPAAVKPPPEFAEVLQKEGATVVATSAGWADTSAGSGTGWGDTTVAGTGWGDTTVAGTGWGDATTDGGWGAAASEVDNDWGGAPAAPATPEDASIWGTARTLFPLLGPTALPLTHTTGVVEWSTRRIARVEPPLAPRGALKKAKGPSAEAVEEELGRRFARVVLVPWPDWDASRAAPDIEKPVILPANRGAVVLDENADRKAKEDGRGEGHNPFTDEICVLVEPKAAEVLEPVVGMGLGATWIEIVRIEGEGEGKKGKEKKGKERVKYWYMEQLMQQLPSYHMDEVEAE